MEARKKFFMDCHLAGRKYHDADEVWDKLKVGTVLHLELEPNNPHDPYAVAVGYYDEEQDEMYRIGYIPREDNEAIANILEMDGRTYSSAASAKSILTHTLNIKFT